MIHEDFECEIYFIRHGQSESNATPGLAAGVNFDAPLTDLGFEQAKLVGERLKREGITFDHVYSSSMTRAIQTTETMLTAMGESDRQFPRIEAIMEQQMPGWRGLPIEEVMTPENIAYMRGKGSHFIPPQGESYRMVQRRYSNWIEDAILYNDDIISQSENLRIAVVSHGAASRCLFHYIMGFDENLIWRIVLDNTSISRFKFNKFGWTPVSINDSSHILAAGLNAASEITP